MVIPLFGVIAVLLVWAVAAWVFLKIVRRREESSLTASAGADDVAATLSAARSLTPPAVAQLASFESGTGSRDQKQATEQKPVRAPFGVPEPEYDGQPMAEAFGRGFSQDVFGTSKIATEEVPFQALPKMDQVAQLQQVRSLVAELRDLRRERVSSDHVEEVPDADHEVFFINGIPMSAPLDDVELTSAENADEVKSRLRDREQAILQRLETIGRRPGIREAYAETIPELYESLHVIGRLEKLHLRKTALQRSIDAKLRSGKFSKAGYAVASSAEEIRILREKIRSIDELMSRVRSESPKIVELERIMEVRAYAQQYQSGMMIEVPTVAAMKEDVLDNMRSRRHFLLAGHLGSGKTEIARQALRQFMIEMGIGYDTRALKAAVETGNEGERARIMQDIQPLIYSANEDSSVYDLIGLWRLEARPSPTPEVAAQEAHEMVDAFKKRGIELPLDEAVKIRMGQANLVETVFRHTALGQAVADGRPIIIDEMNLMRNETRGALNNILTARVGQEVALPGNGGNRYTIKPGFVVVGTLNLGAQYGGTKEINAAQLSRWVGREMDYPEVAETFDLILAALLRGDRASLPPEFPPEEYARLAKLAIVTREVQDLFSGTSAGALYMARSEGVDASAAQLKKSVISPRDLLRNIIEPWRDSAFATSLDDIIASNILARARLAEGKEQKILTEIFIRRGFFAGWDEARFRAAGVASVSQRELDALQVALDDFKKNDTWAATSSDVEQRADAIRGTMMIGNRALNSSY